jgi:CDP-diacylglycerol--inositol 3-phosphatidyltransferase
MVSCEKSGMKSHKSVHVNTPFLMRLYYTDRTVLFLVCAGNELFFMILYGMASLSISIVPPSWWNAGLLLTTPVMVFKQVMNLIQMSSAAGTLAAKDLVESRRAGYGGEGYAGEDQVVAEEQTSRRQLRSSPRKKKV